MIHTKKSKKSQIGATMTWIFALLIIIFILALFVAGTTVIANAKGARTMPSLLIKDNSFSAAEKTILGEKVIGFLESDAGNEWDIYGLLCEAGNNDGKENERQKIFQENATVFLNWLYEEWKYVISFSLSSLNSATDTKKTISASDASSIRQAPSVNPAAANTATWSSVKGYDATKGIKAAYQYTNLYSYVIEVVICNNKKLDFSMIKATQEK